MAESDAVEMPGTQFRIILHCFVDEMTSCLESALEKSEQACGSEFVSPTTHITCAFGCPHL